MDVDWSWIGEAIAVVVGVWGGYERRKRRQAEAEAARTKAELEAIRREAGTDRKVPRRL
jgi:hypothetical protein